MRTCGRSGIKPELKRTLGFLSDFAVAFSYISVSTGTFTNQAVAFGVGGPAIFWAWPLVILGQTFVALNFAELASHFPVAGSIYQWSKRLSNKTLGWFTGWIYFWARRHHGQRRRGHGAARPVDHLSGSDQARRSLTDPGSWTCSRSSPC